MEEQQLTEDQIQEINKKMAELNQRVKADYEDALKELEYRRSLGEDI
jgi:hypothetical protein